MLQKLGLDADSIAVSYWQIIGIGVYKITNIFSFGERILLDFDTCDIGLTNNMTQPMELRCCVLSKVFLVNHFHDIINCSCIWLCCSNSWWLGPKPLLLFPFKKSKSMCKHI